MQGISNGENPISKTMAGLRPSFERRISSLRERKTGASASFSRCLHSSSAVSDDLLTSLEKLDKLKDKHIEGQANLVEALSVKTRNSARHTAMTNDLAAKRARCEQIKKVISDQRNKVDECTTVISKCLHALEACEEKLRKVQSEKENLDSAIAWYQKALGLRVLVGEGVKFIFNKIDSTNPEKEYSFTVQLDNDKYNLLQCDPLVEGIDDLLKEVNETNDFFGFVRVVRGKFASSNLSGT
ncbi:kinetochore protein SPC25 homolog [Carex rostrata]